MDLFWGSDKDIEKNARDGDGDVWDGGGGQMEIEDGGDGDGDGGGDDTSIIMLGTQNISDGDSKTCTRLFCSEGFTSAS